MGISSLKWMCGGGIRVTKEIKAGADAARRRRGWLAILCATAAANYPRLVDRPIQLREFRV